MVIEWRVTNYDDIIIPEGAGLLFQWEGRIPHNVIEMASAVSVQPDCVFVGANAIETGQVNCLLYSYFELHGVDNYKG